MGGICLYFPDRGTYAVPEKAFHHHLREVPNTDATQVSVGFPFHPPLPPYPEISWSYTASGGLSRPCAPYSLLPVLAG